MKTYNRKDIEDYIKKQIGLDHKFKSKAEFAEHFDINYTTLISFLGGGKGLGTVARKLGFERAENLYYKRGKK